MQKFAYTLLLATLSVLFCTTSSFGQRNMEYLKRGTVATPTNGGVLVNWRITGPEYTQNANYNVYRGQTLIASNLTSSNFVDAKNNGEPYTVAAVINGVEQEKSAPVNPLTKQFLTIPVRSINGSYDNYNINDASVGDLDGDGEYEIVIKRIANDATPSSTNYHYLEAYEFDGTFLWAINLGPNILNTVEINFLVYDLDGDGKAEVATRTSDGMIDGTGVNIGDRNNDGKVSYRDKMALNGSYFRVAGPDYLSIFNGETGKEIAWDWYIDLAPLSQWGLAGMNDSQLGHRATKNMWSVAYTDGVNPSFIISRGIYHRIKLEAWHFREGKLTKEWHWDSDPNNVPTAYTGSGFHNYVVGDVDGDGRDEIMYGSMAVDEYGKGMYSTRFEHGDAQHLADINPDKPGLEHFTCHEHANGTTIPGLALRNATTGEIYWKYNSVGDIGRCMSADIDENHKGYEIWGSAGGGIYSSTGQKISNTLPTTAGNGATYNFGVWWDGDVMRELLDRTVITKWNASNQSTDRISTLYNITSISANNSTKSNPSLMADIMGDWREEIIYRSSDNTHLVVFTTPHPTSQRMYTLMHDPNYRTAISWQQNSYNQPPNLGFYFGVGMDAPPAPNINIIKTNEPPTASIISPQNKSEGRINEKVIIKVDATDDFGITKVVFFATNASTMNMVQLGEDTSPPYSIEWTPSEITNYYLVAKVTDTHGLTTNSNIPTFKAKEALPMGFVFEQDNSGDMTWENLNNWTPKQLPTDIDTAFIRSGEVQITSNISSTVVVESGGTYRSTSGLNATSQIILAGGTLKVHTSALDKGMSGPVNVTSPSIIWAGSLETSPFLSDLVFSGNANLTKTHGGILQLQKSSPEFSGNWLIEAGTLTLKAPKAVGIGNLFLADTATLVIGVAGGLSGVDTLTLHQGSILNLNSYTDTTGYLKLGDSLIAPGVYNASDLPFYLKGSGKLIVLYGPEDPIVNAIPSTVSGLNVQIIPLEKLLIIRSKNWQDGGEIYLIDSRGTRIKRLLNGTNDLKGVLPGVYFVVEKMNLKLVGKEKIFIND